MYRVSTSLGLEPERAGARDEEERETEKKEELEKI